MVEGTGPRSEEGDEGNSLQKLLDLKMFLRMNKDTTTVDEDVRIYSDAANRSAADEIFQEGNMAKISRSLKACSSLDPAVPLLRMVRVIIEGVFFLVLFKLLKY